MVTVKLNRLTIVRGGDNLSDGDIYYNIKVNDDVVASRDSGNPLTVPDGTQINLSVEKVVSFPEHNKLSISGTISDRDGTIFEGGDDNISFTDDYASGQKNTSGRGVDTNISIYGSHTSYFANADMAFSLDYEIVDDTPILGSGEPSTPPPPNIADGGVILYQGEDYNSRLTGIGSFRLITPSQFFGIGDFNLPVSVIHHSPVGLGDFIMPGLPPNTSSSLKVGTQIQVTLFDRRIEDRHLGTSTVLFEDVAFLNRLEYNGTEDGGENGWNNKVVSIKVEHYEIRVQ